MTYKKKALSVSFFKLISVVLQLLFVKVYTNFLSMREISQYAYFLAIFIFFNSFIFSPIESYLIYRYRTLNTSIEIPFSWFKASNVMAVVGALLLLSIFTFLLQEKLTNYLIITFTSVLVALGAYYNKILIINSQVKLSGLISSLEWAIKLLLSLSLFSIFASSHSTLILVLFTTSLFTYYFFKKYAMQIEGSREFKETAIDKSSFVKYIIPLMLSGILNWIQVNGYRLFGADTDPSMSEIVAVYATLSILGASIVSIISNIYFQTFSGLLYESSSGNSLNKYILGIFLIVSALSLPLYIFSDLVVGILTSEKFVKFSHVVLFGLFIEMMHSILGAVEVRLNLINKNIFIIYSSSISVLVFLVLIFYFYDKLTLNYLGISILSSLFVQFIFLYSFLRFMTYSK